MFSARVRLDDKVEKFYGRTKDGRYIKEKVIVVNAKARKKKLAALLRVLKATKMQYELSCEDGVKAEVRSVRPNL